MGYPAGAAAGIPRGRVHNARIDIEPPQPAFDGAEQLAIAGGHVFIGGDCDIPVEVHSPIGIEETDPPREAPGADHVVETPEAVRRGAADPVRRQHLVHAGVALSNRSGTVGGNGGVSDVEADDLATEGIGPGQVETDQIVHPEAVAVVIHRDGAVDGRRNLSVADHRCISGGAVALDTERVRPRKGRSRRGVVEPQGLGTDDLPERCRLVIRIGTVATVLPVE